MSAPTGHAPALREPLRMKLGLGLVVAVFLGLVVVVPLAVVIITGFREGIGMWAHAATDPAVVDALELTLLVVLISVPINTFFGLAAAWAVTKHEFRGRGMLVALIDLPFSISPVITGLAFILLFSHSVVAPGLFGGWLIEHDLQVVFAIPGIVLATVFVTFPFVAREVIPAMEARGKDMELAALTLGASGWQTFWRVTLPSVKWAVFHGVVLATARAVGEFGAVSVVSGHRQSVMTATLRIEHLYNESGGHGFTAAFAVSSLLLAIAILTVVAKSLLTRLENRR